MSPDPDAGLMPLCASVMLLGRLAGVIAVAPPVPTSPSQIVPSGVLGRERAPPVEPPSERPAERLPSLELPDAEAELRGLPFPSDEPEEAAAEEPLEPESEDCPDSEETAATG